MTAAPTQLCRLLVLALVALPAVAGEELALHKLIDVEIGAAWQREKVTPASRSTDAEFLRRAYLDLTGVIPAYEEAMAFLADASPDKRTKLIDALLADPRYAEGQALAWDVTFFGRNPPGDDSTRKREPFVKFLRERFAANAPYDQIAREILAAEGNSAEQGAPLFLVQFRNKPEDATVAVTRLFLGIQLQCARCHDHPHEPWSQKDFYGVAAFFARLRVVENGKAGTVTKYVVAEANSGDILFSGPAKDLKPGMKGEPVKAKFLGGADLDEPPAPKDAKEPKTESGKVPPKPAFSRKDKFAAWATSPDNPYFAKAAVNRIWANFMGKGLVDPVDDFSPSAKPSHPKLLDELTRQFKARKFDVKWLAREIMLSDAYQLGGAGGDSVEASPQWYERARVRPLSAEELLRSIRVATGADKPEKKVSVTSDYFVRYFGEPVNGDGVFQGSITEHLFLNNGDDVNRLTQPAKGNLADQLITSTDPIPVKVDRLFLSVLSRPPVDVERERFVAFLSGKEKDALRKAVPQAIWVLLNIGEFRFNQ